MARKPRFLPENEHGVLVEITVRTIGARALLTPSPDPRTFNEVIVGVMGRALEVSPLELCGCVWMGNHHHLLAVAHEQHEISRFMQHLSANVSKEIGGRLRNWSGPFWEGRFHQIVVSDEPEKQWERLAYVLSHGVKEGLVESPMDWPGVHCARSLVHGEPLVGYWWNRSKEWAAQRRGQEVGTYDYATRYEVGFSPLPAFRDLSPEEYQDRVAQLVLEIEERERAKRGENPVAGVEKVLRQDPYKVPTRETKRAPAPAVHAKERSEFASFFEQERVFLEEFWAASERLRGPRGRAAASEFPWGCYPPALPFTGSPTPPRPPAPPTRRLVVEGSKVVERGEIPTVVVPRWPVSGTRPAVVEPQARGQPP
jgi:REP element-mobilizing transposase RayT